MLACVRGGKKHPQHKIYPYLLRELKIERPNQVWCVDITYIPMRRGFLYLVAIMDWYSRKVLSTARQGIENAREGGGCLTAWRPTFALQP